LSDALEHVIYEISKYRQSVADYSQIYQVGGDAAIEFRVLHHRVLLEFFYGSRNLHPDNIVAWEYVSTWQVAHDRAKILWLDAYMDRCHTMLAHISTSRSEIARGGLKAWGQEWQTVERHLDQTIPEFLGGLSVDHKTICLQRIDQMLSSRWDLAPALRLACS
jgi:hypothetical protein